MEWMQKNKDGDGEISGVLYLEGQKTKMLEDNDEAAPFRCVSSLADERTGLIEKMKKKLVNIANTTLLDNVDTSTTSPAAISQTPTTCTKSPPENPPSTSHPSMPNP